MHQFQFHFQFWNLNWAAIPILELSWPNATLDWHWTGNKSLPKPMVTRMCCFMVSPGLSKLKYLLRLQIKGSVSADQRRESSLEASIYNVSIWLQWLAPNWRQAVTWTNDHQNFVSVLRHLGLQIKETVQSWLLTSWDTCCQHTQYEPFLLMVFSGELLTRTNSQI